MEQSHTKWQHALRQLVSLKYLNRWIVLGSDLVVSVLVSVVGVLGLFSLMHLDITVTDVLKMGAGSFLVSILAFITFKVYRGVIRHSTLRGLWRIGAVAIMKVGVMYPILFLIDNNLSYEMYWVAMCMDCVLTMVMLVALRVLAINVYNIALSHSRKKRKKVLVYGTGDRSVMMATSTNRQVFMQNYSIDGFLTFGTAKKNIRIAELSVYEIENEKDLAELVVRNSLDGILFADIKAVQREQDRLVRYCEQLSLKTLVVPDMEEVRDGEVKRSIREVKIEDLLGRDEIEINLKEIGALLKGKTILVTGAAGSIGSEICRQLAHFDIARLVCFDAAETPMHTLRLELEETFKGLDFVPVIGDVRNADRVDYVYRNWSPQVVFHAAAYKHVPLMEENPCEAVRTNVYGTRIVADAAVKYGIEKFVMVSTDKAVNPTNIMGCSKRLAEIYVQSLSIAIAKGEVTGNTRFITTRFGNVLGSNGSVIPRFREQISKGGPVTVTHPDIIRYFMTIPEACRLVLEAGTMGKGGEIFIFDMGEPVRIVDLAKRMIELSGLRLAEDIEIKYTGLRPGEKLYEELLSSKECTQETPHEKIRVAAVREYEYGDVAAHIALLTELSRAVKITEMVTEMKAFVPEFRSKNSVFEKLDGGETPC